MQNEKCKMKNAGKNGSAAFFRCFQFYILHFEFLILSTSPLCPARFAPQGAICAGPLFGGFVSGKSDELNSTDHLLRFQQRVHGFQSPNNLTDRSCSWMTICNSTV